MFDQDRLGLSLRDATRRQRVWGISVSLRNEANSANTATPASAQVLIRLTRWGPNVDDWRSFCPRVTAFSASCTPRLATGQACNSILGDMVSGIIESPHSARNSTALEAWGFVMLGEFLVYSAISTSNDNYSYARGKSFRPIPFSILPLTMLLLRMRTTFINSEDVISTASRIFRQCLLHQPLVPKQFLQTVSAQTGSLEEADEETRTLRQAKCDGFSFSRPCNQCVIDRNAIARNPRSPPPSKVPPRPRHCAI